MPFRLADCRCRKVGNGRRCRPPCRRSISLPGHTSNVDLTASGHWKALRQTQKWNNRLQVYWTNVNHTKTEYQQWGTQTRDYQHQRHELEEGTWISSAPTMTFNGSPCQDQGCLTQVVSGDHWPASSATAACRDTWEARSTRRLWDRLPPATRRRQTPQRCACCSRA